jgi:hypothetical protein
VHLELSKMDDGVSVITGTVDSGGGPLALTGYHAESFSLKTPAPQAGRYTVMLPPAPVSGVNGFGYGTAKVSKFGGTRVAGVLGDGTPFSAAANLSEGGFVLISTSLYAKGGYVDGWVHFRDIPDQSDFDGSLGWSRPAKLGAAQFSTGFTFEIPIFGARYVPPVAGTSIFRYGSGEITFAGGDLNSPLVTPVTLGARNLVTATAVDDSSRLRLTLETTTGAFSGSFRNPFAAPDAKGYHFRGVIFPKSGIAAGQFKSPGGFGSIELAE